MQITLFKNKTGLIHGSDPKRISCARGGLLRIGQTEIPLKADAEEIMPMLFQGCSGKYPASFVTENGDLCPLADVCVRGGWMQPPPALTAEITELRIRAEEAESRIDELSRIFDTNALNFLIDERRTTK